VADFSILDLSSPETVRGDDVKSKCRWSAYERLEYPGRARWTIKRGEPLLDDFEQAS
jgi:dihydroorotase-like cyclic amidohydrolase